MSEILDYEGEWTPERMDREFTMAKLRRNQDLCKQQMRMAFDQGKPDALATLQRWEAAYTAAIMVKQFGATC